MASDSKEREAIDRTAKRIYEQHGAAAGRRSFEDCQRQAREIAREVDREKGK